MNAKQISESIFLVVDDEEFIRTLVEQLLQELGARRVLLADSGLTGLEILKQVGTEVDCIISDFKMPDMTGIEFAQAIRSGQVGIERDLPFALLTAYSDKTLLGLAMVMDVDAFISKPVTKQKLQSRVSPLLTRARRQLLPAENYDRIVLEDSTSDLDVQVVTLERIIRDKVVAGRSIAEASKRQRPPEERPNPPPTRQTNAGDLAAKSASIAVTLQSVPQGAILASDLRSEAGSLLLAAGTVLDDRILDLLHHIVEMGEDFSVLHITE